jgi:uncharacterized protein YbjT (DUF2867 family)
MKVLLTGATGYIGKRLLPVLVNKGHTVVCCVRDANKFHPNQSLMDKIEIIENDLTDKDSLHNMIVHTTWFILCLLPTTTKT